jgi:hypothetical protein
VWYEIDHAKSSFKCVTNLVSVVTRESGDGWTVELNEGVMIWEFLSSMELSEFGQGAYDTFDELLQKNRVDAIVRVS